MHLKKTKKTPRMIRMIALIVRSRYQICEERPETERRKGTVT